MLDIRRKIWRRSLRVLMIFGNNFSIGRYETVLGILSYELIENSFHDLGEDACYKNRVFLLYDGVHYDPLALEKEGEIIQTTFSVDDHNIQIEAMKLAQECKRVRAWS